MRNQQPVEWNNLRTIPRRVPTCDFKDCTQPGEHVLVGDARLCLEHFLRDRVRLNLARLNA